MGTKVILSASLMLLASVPALAQGEADVPSQDLRAGGSFARGIRWLETSGTAPSSRPAEETSLWEAKAAAQDKIRRSNLLYMEASQLFEQHRFAGAIEKFQGAVELDPRNAEAWNGLGWVYFNIGLAPQAMEAWQECLKRAPKHPGVLNGMGHYYLDAGRYEEAEKHLLAAAGQDAAAAWSGLIRLYLLQEKWEDAQKWADKLTAKYPDAPWPQYHVKMFAAAKAHKVDARLRSAIEPHQTLAQSTQPSAAAMPLTHAAIRSRALAFDARSELQASPMSPDALKNLGEAVEIDPGNDDAWNLLGWAYFYRGADAEARRAWQKYRQLATDNPKPLCNLSLLSQKERQYDKAAEYLLAAESLSRRSNPGLWEALASVYLLAGRFEQAQPWAEKLISAWPDDEPAREMLVAAKDRKLGDELRSRLESVAATRPSSASQPGHY